MSQSSSDDETVLGPAPKHGRNEVAHTLGYGSIMCDQGGRKH